MDSFSAEFISRFNDKLAKPWSSDGVVFQITNDFVEKTLINVLEAGKSSLEYVGRQVYINAFQYSVPPVAHWQSRLLIGLACAYDSKPDVRSALRARLAEISRITQEKLTKPSDQFVRSSSSSSNSSCPELYLQPMMRRSSHQGCRFSSQLWSALKARFQVTWLCPEHSLMVPLCVSLLLVSNWNGSFLLLKVRHPLPADFLAVVNESLAQRNL